MGSEAIEEGGRRLMLILNCKGGRGVGDSHCYSSSRKAGSG